MSKSNATTYLHVAWALSVIFWLLPACGTEIGNGWKTDDGTSKKDPQTSGSQVPNQEDSISTGDDESENGLPESDAGKAVLPDNQYEIDLLLAECGSPFGEAIATEDYRIVGVTNSEGGNFAYWIDNRWVYTTDEQSENIYRYVTPKEGEPRIALAAKDETATSSGITCSDRTEDEAARIDDEPSFRSVALTLTLASGKTRELTWFVDKENHRLVRIEIESADLEPAVLSVLDPDE